MLGLLDSRDAKFKPVSAATAERRSRLGRRSFPASGGAVGLLTESTGTDTTATHHPFSAPNFGAISSEHRASYGKYVEPDVDASAHIPSETSRRASRRFDVDDGEELPFGIEDCYWTQDRTGLVEPASATLSRLRQISPRSGLSREADDDGTVSGVLEARGGLTVYLAKPIG